MLQTTMAVRRCPRCDAALSGRRIRHLRCVLTRMRFVLGGVLLALAIIAAGTVFALNNIH
jgi:hypothetical protein